PPRVLPYTTLFRSRRGRAPRSFARRVAPASRHGLQNLLAPPKFRSSLCLSRDEWFRPLGGGAVTNHASPAGLFLPSAARPARAWLRPIPRALRARPSDPQSAWSPSPLP